MSGIFSGMPANYVAATIWIIIFAAALIWEIVSLGLTSIWFCGGAVAAAIVAYLGVNPYVQIILFIVVSTILLLLCRPIAKKKLIAQGAPTNLDRNIGKKVKILETVDASEGTGLIKLGDVEWKAVSENGSVIPKDSFAEIVNIEGTKVYLREVIN
ncbi:MAG: NfeD family protein [Eubacterium sp.]|nr:NfeD family protein [Eubacterium sp.]